MIDFAKVRFAPRDKLTAFDLRWRRRGGASSYLYKDRSWVRRDTFAFTFALMPSNHKTKMLFRLSILALTSPPNIEKNYNPIKVWITSKRPTKLKKIR